MYEDLERRIGEIALEGVDVHRCIAIQTLGEIKNPNSLTLFCNALLDEDEDVRIDGAIALGKLNDVSAEDALLENLVGDPCGEVKIVALKSLISLGSEKVIPWLKKLVIARSNDMVWDDELNEGWDDWLDLQVLAMEGLGSFNITNAIALIHQALADENAQDLIEHAALSFTKMGDAGFVALVSLLDPNDERCRRIVAHGLGNVPPVRAEKKLTILLNDEAANVRLEAAKSIFKHTPDDNRLLPLFWDEDSRLRAFAVSSLGGTNTEWLKQCLTDENNLVIEATLSILCQFPQENTEEPVYELAIGPEFDPMVIRALETFNQSQALDLLEKQISDGNTQALNLVLEIAQAEQKWPNRATDILFKQLSKNRAEEQQDVMDIVRTETAGISTLDEILTPQISNASINMPSNNQIENSALALQLLGYLPRIDVLQRLIKDVGDEPALEKTQIQSIMKLLSSVQASEAEIVPFITDYFTKGSDGVRQIIIEGLSHIQAPWGDALLHAEIKKIPDDRLDLILSLCDKTEFIETLMEAFERANFSQQQKIIMAIANSMHEERIKTLMRYACAFDGVHNAFIAEHIKEADKPTLFKMLCHLLEDNQQKIFWSVAMQMTAKLQA